MRSSRRSESRLGSTQLAVDVGLPVALLLALAIVFGIERFGGKPVPQTPALEIVEPGESPQPQAPIRRLRIGVTPMKPEFDDMGKLLDSLGEGYRYQPFSLNDLQDLSKILEFDVIFITCSGVPQSWLDERVGEGPREGTEVFTANEAVLERVHECLKKYVRRGKTLYVSDLHFNLVAGAFPEFVDEAKAGKGKVQNLTADVVDAGLKELLGAELPLKFDQPGWRPAAFDEEKAAVFLRGTFTTTDGDTETAPLLVRFPVGDGTVIFTSFHNEAQNNEMELKLLRYLVFSAMTAEVDTRVNRMMVKGGFSPAKKGLFSASAAEPSVTKTYSCTKAADLQFVLGFQSQGARLKLAVTGPDGRAREKQGTSTLTIDVPNAAVGEWQYTVTALDLPNENFPFTVTVGEK